MDRRAARNWRVVTLEVRVKPDFSALHRLQCTSKLILILPNRWRIQICSRNLHASRPGPHPCCISPGLL